METKVLIEEAYKLTKDIVIPNQPHVIQDLDKKLRESDIDFKSISNLISKDVALTAKVIKIANAPFWGSKRKIESIEKSLFVLGLKNFKNIVLTSCLRDLFKADSVSHEQIKSFHNHSMHVAVISQYFAAETAFEDNFKLDKEQAYLAGLFHDCGMMLMAQKFDDYFENCIIVASNETDIITMEQEKYKMNHAMVSCMLINKWKLPQLLIEPILYHHESNIDRHKNKYIKQMSAILKMAEHFVSYIPGRNKNEVIFDFYIQDQKDLEKIKAFMKIDDGEYKYLQDKISDLIDALSI